MKKPRKKESWTIRGVCVLCEKNPQVTRGTKNGVRLYKSTCASCERNLSRKKFQYRLHKKDSCERCGFVAENSCQLDVHHVDGNHRNNTISNLKTLCANCHRLVHALA